MTYGIPPGELYDRLDADDLEDLTAYYAGAPWGPEIDDIRDARRLMFQAAASGVTLDPKDVMLGSDSASEQTIQMDAEEFEALFKGAAMKQMAASPTIEASIPATTTDA